MVGGWIGQRLVLAQTYGVLVSDSKRHLANRIHVCASTPATLDARKTYLRQVIPSAQLPVRNWCVSQLSVEMYAKMLLMKQLFQQRVRTHSMLI